MKKSKREKSTKEVESSEFLGTAKLGKLMLKFCVPCILSLLVSALYNVVDQIFIGNSELSMLGNAATGVVFPIFVIAQAFAWCIGDGCAAYLNICQGRGDAGSSHKSVGNGMLLTLVSSCVLMAVFYPLKIQLLYLFGASDNSIGYAVEYFNIILGFFPAYMLSNMMNAVARADGAPGWSMASMLAGAAVNIVLDPTFIFGFKLGMAGAAWATVIGQVVSLAVSVFYFFRTRTFKLCLKSFIPDFKAVLPALKLGISSFITQATIVIISLVCNVMLAKYGSQSQYGADIPIAVIGIESKVFTVVINIVVGIVLGSQPIIGYNLGSGNIARVKKLYLYIISSTVAVALIATVIFEACPNAVISLFGSPTQETLKGIPEEMYWEFGAKTFRIFLMFIAFTCVIKMSSIFFQAVGKPVFAVIASLIRDIVCFIPLICTMPLAMGIDGILWSAPVADAAAFLITLGLTIAYFAKLNGMGKCNSEEEKSSEEETFAQLAQKTN